MGSRLQSAKGFTKSFVKDFVKDFAKDSAKGSVKDFTKVFIQQGVVRTASDGTKSRAQIATRYSYYTGLMVIRYYVYISRVVSATAGCPSASSLLALLCRATPSNGTKHCFRYGKYSRNY